MSILKTVNLTIRFGGLVAVEDFNINIEQGEMWAIIGPNGAGKTTVYNMITGIYAPTSGEIYVDGQNMKGMKPYQFARAGVSRTFQNIRLFGGSTVLDNVKMAHTLDCNYRYWDMMVRNKKYHAEEDRITKESLELLELFGLEDKKDYFATQLPYGEQRKLEIVRALATKPKILLLDEPAAGMSPGEIDDVMALIHRIHDEMNQTILMIEHHMKLVMGIAQQIKVLEFGRTISEGTPEYVQNDPLVIAAYLGGDPDAHA